jgi:uncharacterized membrane protein YphA (DoxX/SURF4 family)
MTLLRAAARTLLASYFIVSGVKAVRDPGPLVPLAEPLADKLVPLIKQYAPGQIANYIPEDAAALVRINGAAQVVGGLALATGKGRRLGAVLLAGSLIPSTIAKHPFWTRDTAEERAIDRNQFRKNVSLLGGVILAARDTEGKPGLVWRAQRGGHSLVKDTRKSRRQMAKSTHALADTALAGGATLVTAVVTQSRKAKKVALQQAAEAKEAAERAAKQARKDAKKFAKTAPKRLESAKKEASKQAKIAGKQLAATRKEAGKRVNKVKKAAGEFASNINLGEN